MPQRNSFKTIYIYILKKKIDVVASREKKLLLDLSTLRKGRCCGFSDISVGSLNKGLMQIITFNYQAFLTTGRPRFEKATWKPHLRNCILQDH